MSETPSKKYIVVFKEHITKDQVNEFAEDVKKNGGDVTNVYDSVLNGFAAVLPDSFFNSLQGDDAIDYIEPDGVVTTQ